MLNKRRISIIALFFIICIALNVGGKYLAAHWNLPIWMDSYGTAVAAYVAGPFAGALVGLSANLIYGIWDTISFFYAPVGLLIGLVIGIAARRGALDTVFGTMNTSAFVTLTSLLSSLPVNLLLQEGRTGNVWGDAAGTFFAGMGANAFLQSALSEFYVDFLDKLILVLLMYYSCRFFRNHIRNNPLFRKKQKRTALIMNGILIVALLLHVIYTATGAAYDLSEVQAKENEVLNNYNSYVQTIYNRENGLSCGEANCTAFTKDGVLWVGTYGGLYRYSGTRFQLMNEYDSIKNVNCLYVDEEGRLWVGTNDNGISLVINSEVANVLDEDGGLPSNSVRSICEDTNGNYYAGTSDALAIFTINNGIKVKKEIKDIQYVRRLSANQDGLVAAISNKGVLYILLNGEVLSMKETEMDSETFNSCMFLADGTLVVGTSKSRVLWYDFQAEDRSFTLKKHIYASGLSNIQSFYEAENHDLIMTSDNGAGYVTASGIYSVLKTGTFTSSLDDVQMDYQGNIWISSSRLGLLKLCRSAFSELYHVLGYDSEVVNTEVMWNGLMYFGTDSGLDIANLDRISIVKNDLTTLLNGVRIRCLKVDSNNKLWIATAGDGIYIVDPDGTWMHLTEEKDGIPGKKYRNILELSDGTVYVGGDAGIAILNRYSVSGLLKQEDGLENEKILSLMEMADGSVLAGTDGGGIAVIRDHKVEKLITKKDGLSSGVIMRTVSDPNQNGVYIVASNGLSYMDQNGTIKDVEKFPYNNNFDITFYNGRCFILGSAGIYAVDTDSIWGDGELSYTILDSKSGMRDSITSNAWNYLSEDGILYIACDSGCCSVDLNKVESLTHSYRLMVSRLKADSQQMALSSDNILTLNREVENVTFYPEVINYSVNDPYVSYYLEGYDTQETVLLQSELNSIEYSNLPIGDYSFHLAVLGEDKETVLEEVVYTISKEADLSDHWWFTIYIVAVFAIAVAWLSWFITRALLQRTISLQGKELELERNKVMLGNETILAIARTVDAKDPNTAYHSMRVSEYSVLIAKKIGYTDEQVENLRKMALLHDIGKIKIPDAILNKPAKLTQEEYEKMKKHTIYGGEILKGFTLVDHVADGALYHHERWDGSGYPFGLKETEIPINARIIAISDAFDAMTAKRVYRERMDFRYVLSQLKNGRGTQFDPELLDIFLELIETNSIDVHMLYDDSMDPEIQKSITHTSIIKALQTDVLRANTNTLTKRK